MLKILAWIAAALGGIALVLLALLVLALLPRARVVLDKPAEGALRLSVGYGFLRIPILPLPKKKGGKRPAAKPKPRAEKPAKHKKPGGFSVKNLDLGEAICLALDLLYELRDRMKIHRLRADVMIATGDAAKTGILLGRSAAVTGMILPFLEQNFVIPDFHIAVDGDFQSETASTRFSCGVTVSIRPIHLPLILMKYRRRLIKLYHDLRAETPQTTEKTEEKENAK